MLPSVVTRVSTGPELTLASPPPPLAHALLSPRRVPEAGRYDGTFLDGLRQGRGLMAFANGDRYTGDFGHDSVRNVGSLLNGDEYMDGGPSNFGVFEFVDGAT